MVHLPHGTNSTLSPCDYDLTLSPLPYRACTNKTGASHDKIYHCGVDHCVRARSVVGRATAPTAVFANAAKIQAISIDELTRKAGPLSVESFDAV